MSILNDRITKLENANSNKAEVNYLQAEARLNARYQTALYALGDIPLPEEFANILANDSVTQQKHDEEICRAWRKAHQLFPLGIKEGMLLRMHEEMLECLE